VRRRSLLLCVKSAYVKSEQLLLLTKSIEKNPERNVRLIVCGDFNGGEECGAVRFLEDGFIDESFREDGEAVASGRKPLPLEKPLKDVVTSVDRVPPSTLVVPELISTMVKGQTYENPSLSDQVIERLQKIYDRLSTHRTEANERVMNLNDVERYLVAINGQVGRGSEFREAARQMGWTGEDVSPDDEESKDENPRITLPAEGLLSLDGFIRIYEAELNQGKFWGIAHDLSVLGEPLPNVGVFQSRFDRMYYSNALQPTAVMDFVSSDPCPNELEPSDHLPLAASFCLK
jgi:hypothetical protein